MSYQQSSSRKAARRDYSLNAAAQITANQQGFLTSEQRGALARRQGNGCLLNLTILLLICSLLSICGLFGSSLETTAKLAVGLGLGVLIISMGKLVNVSIKARERHKQRYVDSVVIEQAQGQIAWTGAYYQAHTSDFWLSTIGNCELPAPGPYLFYYTAGEHLLLSAQPIHSFSQPYAPPGTVATSQLSGDELARQGLQAALCSVLDFSLDDLDANRIGMLSDRQRHKFSREIYGKIISFLASILIGSLFILVPLGLAFYIGGSQAIASLSKYLTIAELQKNGGTILTVALVFLVIAALFAGQLLVLIVRLIEVRRGSLLTIEGLLTTHEDGDSEDTFYYYDIGSEHFSVSVTVYTAMISGTYCRVSYMESPKRLISVEVLKAPIR